MESIINKLKEIKKDELDERSFYERVLSTIQEMKDVALTLTPETAEQLQIVLKDIGCKRYDDWETEKEKNGETIEDVNNIYNTLSFKSHISDAVDLVSGLFERNIDLIKGQLLHITNNKIQKWLLFNESMKRLTPYYIAAAESLINRNGLTGEEAESIVLSKPFDEIESQASVKSSMDYAIDGILKYYSDNMEVPVSDSNRKDLVSFVYNGIYTRFANTLKIDYYQEGRNRQNDMIMDTLFSVHDGWVKDNQKEFMASDKKHKHMPSELIGWEEVKSYLLYVRPIFKKASVEVNEEVLEQVYNDRVKDFFLNRGIKNVRDLSDSIIQGEEFYPALEEYGDILATIANPDYVDEKIIPAIEQQGIGNIEEIRRNIVSQIISNPVLEDVARLSEEEKAQLEQSLREEVDVLTAERDELHKKNSIAERILELARRRRTLEVEIKEGNLKKSEIAQSFLD